MAQDGAAAQVERAPRAERSERVERGEGRRNGRGERDGATPVGEEMQARGSVDSLPAEGATAEGERDGQRRRRRGGRGGRDRDEARSETLVNAEAALGAEAPAPEQALGLTDASDAEREPMAVDTMPGEETGAMRSEREGGRRRGGRGRNRREGREAEGGDRPLQAPVDASGEFVAQPQQPPDPQAVPATVEALASVAPAANVAPAVTASAVPEAPTAAAPFALPIDDLRALAASAGLEWVNSDAERILVVQQAMASEPKPVHVPRTPRPRVVIDEGPLVLVETRKDLSQLKLPFEQQQQAPAT